MYIVYIYTEISRSSFHFWDDDSLVIPGMAAPQNSPSWDFDLYRGVFFDCDPDFGPGMDQTSDRLSVVGKRYCNF